MLPNALAPGGLRVSANVYARLFNFKANHRKVALSEAEAVVASANPHDASAPNSNLGLRVRAAGDAGLTQEFSACWSLIWNNEPVDGAQTIFTLPYATKAGGAS